MKLCAHRLLALSAALVPIYASAANAGARKPSVPSAPDIDGVLNSNSYGYDLTCVINGHDIGIEGGKSESQREFAENSKEAAEMAPKQRGKYAPLHIGRNTVKITYRRKLPKEPFGLDITFQVLGYPVPLFYAHLENDDRDAGTFEGTFDIAATPAAGAKPLVLTTSDPATSGLLFVDQDAGGDGLLIPTLNGNTLMQLLGRPRGVVPFTGLHPGANTLTIKYSTKGKPLHLFILGPKSASMHVLQSALKTETSFIVQGPDLVVSER